jgi:E3 ubiquitin-protein ligase DOA10
MCEAVVTLSREVSKQDELVTVDDICWICHEGNSTAMPLAEPCRCKAMRAHRPCLARWQLQQAGRRYVYAIEYYSLP